MIEALRAAPQASTRPGAALARFHAARGRRVVERAGVFWVPFRYGFWTSLPDQLELDPDARALDGVLRAGRALALLYPVRSGGALRTGIYVCAPGEHSLSSLDDTHRKHVRRGLQRCELRRLEPGELLELGLELNLETMARQRRHDPEFGEPRRWARYVAAVAACAEVSAIGAFVEGRLSAWLVACRDGAWLHLLHKMSRTADLPHRVNAAIDFHAIREAARDPSIAVVSAGFGPYLGIDPPAEPFKAGMGYRLVPRTLAARFHPLLRPALASAPAARGAAALARARPSHRLRVLAALLGGGAA
jgi:hypothetical protein